MKRNLISLTIGLLIFIIYLYFFVDINEMIAVVQHINLFYYLLAVVVLILAMLTNALTWHYFLLAASMNLSFKRTFIVTWISFVVEFFVPSESIGEDISRLYLMSKRENVGKVLASIVGNRILSIIITLGTLIISFVSFVALQYKFHPVVLNLMLLIMFAHILSLVIMFLLWLKQEWTQKFVDLLLRLFNFILKRTSLKSRIKNILKDFHSSIEVFTKNRKSLVTAAIFSSIGYFLSVFLSFLVFVSLGFVVNIITLAIVYSVSRCLQSVPTMLPGEIGFLEIVMTNLYALLGIPLGISAVATILIRGLWIWVRLPIGFIAMATYDMVD